jgi:DNA-binding response OmpR family regulator
MSIVRPILVIENDDALRAVLVEHLVASGEFQPVEAVTLREALQFLGAAGARFDSILLNIALPDGDGINFCRELRRQGHKMPIVLFGGVSADADVIRGLDAGANDYLTDTARLNEMLARLRAQLRLFDNSVDAVLTIGSYTFRPLEKLLVNSETKYRINLSNKEAELLKFLHRSGRFVTRQILLRQVWGYAADVLSATVDTHIYDLRRKMKADPDYRRLLITMPGGYQLARTSVEQEQYYSMFRLPLRADAVGYGRLSRKDGGLASRSVRSDLSKSTRQHMQQLGL